MTPEDVEKAIRDAREAYEKYRSSGLAVSALVVSVSGASAYQLVKQESAFAIWFLTPVILAFIHQIAHYIGSLHHARTMFYWACNAGYLQRKQIHDAYRMKEESGKAQTVADKFFSFAEYLCISSVASLCLLLLICGTVVLNCPWNIIFLILLIVVVGICWKYRGTDIFAKAGSAN